MTSRARSSAEPDLRALAPAHRARVRAVLQAAATAAAPADLDAVRPLAGVLVAAVPAALRPTALAFAEEVAVAFPAGVPALLRSLGPLFEEATSARVGTWLRHGLALAAERPDAGLAYFALASRTSRRVLDDSPTAVILDEVQGALRKLVHMLSGSPAVPRPSGAFQLRPPLEDAPGAGMAAFPASVDRGRTYEDNARLYRVVAATLTGRREHGTYDVPDLTAHLRRTGVPTALEELFLVADGYRVACALGSRYPGLAADLRWAGETLLANDARPLALWDALLALALARRSPGRSQPALVAAAALVLPALAPLAEPGASAADALRVAERLAAFFPDAVRPGDAGEVMPELMTLLLDAGGGEDDLVGERIDDAATALAGEDGPPLPEDLRAALELLVEEHLEDAASGGRPLGPEELRRLLESGALARLAESDGALLAQAGLYVTQLVGKRLGDAPATPADVGAGILPARRPLRAFGIRETAVHLYDEWDHGIADYRRDWCQLREIALTGDSGLYFDGALARHAALVPEIRRHFQRLRPELYRPLRGLEDGEEIDLGAVIDARAARRARQPASSKLYASRVRQERDVATLFLLDMSASTDETAPNAGDRIIDIAKDALVIMAAALEEIGDAYAIYGFSGQGRDNVEVYPVKSFTERLTPSVQSRIGGIEPRGSTRMGTALRHALGKMRGLTAPARHLILLSDGFPQDLDYGADRQSHVYGIRDTAAALRELQGAGVRPFCITVDLAGHDYLREMCDPQQYLIIENVAGLPRELPKIYQRLVRAA